MDKALRNTLRSVVTQCRKLLEEAAGELLQGQFGIHGDGEVEDVVRLTHLTPDDLQYREEVLAQLEHIKASGLKPKDATEQLVREAAFTHLNRLSAYKMMTSRGLIKDAVGKGLKSRGFLFYLADHPSDEALYNSAQQDQAYRHYLDYLNESLSSEIGVLFAREDLATRLFPPYRVLVKVLDLINSEELANIWAEDETIGWVYQYFTPKELRDRARKESAAPRNSYELAFRNQFYTPRYVVEFLVDNTLGRLWYEMSKGETSLAEKCRYLIRRPNEIFLSPDEEPPEGEEAADVSQEELFEQAVYIRYRQKKDPREIKILDPASGSGHFLLYCFGLLEVIYQEAFENAELGTTLRNDYAKLEDLKRDIPRLILENNLHGIDIDLRSTQISALALWLRCQSAYKELGLENGARPQIRKTNIVCAEPMPGESELLDEFVKQVYPPFLGEVVRVVFEKMKLAGEAGSLLKVESEISEAIAEAKKHWRVVPEDQQLALFRREKLSDGKQGALFDLSGITDQQFWDEAEARVLESLREYSLKVASTGQGFLRRLFADDAERGFSFVDTCRKRFDVVLMNPPFGSPSLPSEDYLRSTYPESQFEIYGQFLLRAVSLCSGYVGAITSRGFLYLANFLKIRDAIYPHLTLFVDLGGNVLDNAFVEVCAFILGAAQDQPIVECIDARQANLPATEQNRIPNILLGLSRLLFDLANLKDLPARPFCYDTPPSLLRMSGSRNTVESVTNGIARVGLATGDNERFVRCYWEVPRKSINARWRYYAKGGEYLPFKPDVHLVVDWIDDGHAIEDSFEGARIKKYDVYFHPAVTYSRRSLKGLSFRILPKGCICGEKGPVIIAEGHEYAVLALTNSTPYKYLVGIQCAASAFEIGTIQRAPVPLTFASIETSLAEFGRSLAKRYMSLAYLDETDVSFQWPQFWKQNDSLQDMVGSLVDHLRACKEESRRFLVKLDSLVLDAYKWSADHKPEDDYEIMLELFDLEDARNFVGRLVVSVCFGVALGEFPSGPSELSNLELDPYAPLPRERFLSESIAERVVSFPDEGQFLVDDAGHEDDIIRCVRDIFESSWPERADDIEREACSVLGVKELRDYFRRPSAGGFWMDHVKRYSKSRRKAPIYWLLRSSKGNYSIWLHYHRLDKDILYKALLNYVEPKIRLEENNLAQLRSQREAVGTAGREAKLVENQFDKQETFLSELLDFRDKLKRAADLHLEPDLNDGVVLNIAPLWELVPWTEAKKYWNELLEGKYEWSSIGRQLREKGLVKP